LISINSFEYLILFTNENVINQDMAKWYNIFELWY